MDFVRDTLADGRVFRAFTLVDDCTRECPVIEVDTSLSGGRVVVAWRCSSSVLDIRWRTATSRASTGNYAMNA
jgi:hypothetical protein